MSILCDNIENFIKDLLNESGIADIRRGELAQRFSCAPSQINYVLTTRFTPVRGYITQSRRGEGGYIRVIKKDIETTNHIVGIIEGKLNDGVSFKDANEIAESLYLTGIINEREKIIVLSAVSDRALKIDKHIRNNVRANLLKQILLNII